MVLEYQTSRSELVADPYLDLLNRERILHAQLASEGLAPNQCRCSRSKEGFVAYRRWPREPARRSNLEIVSEQPSIQPDIPN